MTPFLDCLARRHAFAGRAALVVAHPDDETIALGGSFPLLPGLLLVHVTDGAPRRNADAARHGFSPEGYAAAREAELAAALGVAGFRGERRRLGVADQEAVLHLPELVERLAGLLAGADAVLTHAYEGGHPDHDAAAFAVHAAARKLGAPVCEFAGYHAAPGRFTPQLFLPGAAETAVALPPADATRKRAALDCFATQAETLRPFATEVERFRPAPEYDFTAPPHPGPLNYELWGFEMTGAQWRERAGTWAREAARCGG